MDNIKDKLIEITKNAIADNAIIEDDCIMEFDCNDFDHACEAIAYEIMENLPDILADSEWVRLPCELGDIIYYICGDEIKSIINDKSHKTINVYEDNRITEAEAEAKLAELKGAKK